MFKINGSDYTVLVIALVGTILFFLSQLIICLKGRKVWIKLIPVYLIMLSAFCCLAIYIGLFGTYAAGAVSGNQVVALLLTVIVGIATVGDVMAWIVYGIIHNIHSRKIGKE